MKKYSEWVIERWRPLLASLALAVIMIGVLVFRLGTLNRGATMAEISYLNSLHSGKHLVSDPVFLIHKIPAYILFKLGFHSIAAYRLVSVVFTSATVISCFIILKRAYSVRVATLGSILLLTSAWILHTGRSATPESSLLLVLPLLLVATWLHTTTRHYLSLSILSLVVVVSFYIPGLWWLAMALVINERAAILSALKAISLWKRASCGLVVLAGLTPLIWATAHNPSVFVTSSGLPVHLSSLSKFPRNLTYIPRNLFIFGPTDPARWLGRLPILDIFAMVMLILGAYSLRYHLRQQVTAIIVGSSLIITVLIATGGMTTITALIPLLYIFVGAGIAFMLQQWVTVFPRNPVARTLATTLMSITVLLVSYFHINHYFIAWPQTPATKHVFGYSLLK